MVSIKVVVGLLLVATQASAKAIPAQVGSMDMLERDLSHLEKDSEPKKADFLLAYFRHSIKTSKWDKAYDMIFTEAAKGKLEHYEGWTRTNEAGEEIAGDPDMLKKSFNDFQDKNFKSHGDLLAGNSKEQCPKAIGKMLKSALPSDKEHLTVNLWSSGYERVLLTGMQMKAGVSGVEVDALKEGNLPTDETTAAETKQKLVQLLYSKELGGQWTQWVVEHVRDFGYPDDGKTSKEKFDEVSANAPEVRDKDNKVVDFKEKRILNGLEVSKMGWDHDNSCIEVSAYGLSPEKTYFDDLGRCVGHKFNDADKASVFGTEQGAQEKRNAMHEQSDKDIEMLLGAITSDEEFKELFVGFEAWKEKYAPEVECQNQGFKGYLKGYAGGFCRVGNYLLNERSNGVGATNSDYLKDKEPDYKKLIKACKDAGSCDDPNDAKEEACKECDRKINMLMDICWPYWYKGHLVAANTGVGNPSMSLLLGAIAKRAGLNILDSDYKQMLTVAEAAVPDKYEVAELTGLKDDGGDVLLMSSHDLTTNAMRIMMREAGLPIKTQDKYSDKDRTKMGLVDEMSYSVMFVWDIKGDELEIKGFTTTLEQARLGCPDEAFQYENIETVWAGKVTEFLKTMSVYLISNIEDGNQNSVHTATLVYLKALQVATAQ